MRLVYCMTGMKTSVGRHAGGLPFCEADIGWLCHQRERIGDWTCCMLEPSLTLFYQLYIILRDLRVGSVTTFCEKMQIL